MTIQIKCDYVVSNIKDSWRLSDVYKFDRRKKSFMYYGDNLIIKDLSTLLVLK